MELAIREIDVNSVITKSNLPVCDFSLNPYVGCPHACKYCYASFMKRFTNHPEPWGTFIDIKYWQPIKNPHKYDGKELFIGSVTDPYNPAEEKYKRTRALLEELSGTTAKLSIATKSALVLRDLELIKSFPNARVSWSINTLNDTFRSDMDNAASIESRLAAMKVFHDAGIRTTCFISPIFPEITNVKAIIEKAQDRCNLVWLENLNLRGDYKAIILKYIKEKYAGLYPLYDAIYNKGDMSYWQALDREIADYAKQSGLDYVIDDDSMKRDFFDPPVIVNFYYHEKIKRSAKEGK